MRSLFRLWLVAVVAGWVGCKESRPTPPVAGAETAGVAAVSREAPQMFYPGTEKELAETVEKLLAEAEAEPVKSLRALICPHAGYEFSGKTAAIAYKQLAGRDIRTVVVLAPSHYAAFEGGSIPDAGAYRTPLGLVPVSPKAAQLAKTSPFALDAECEVHRPQWWRVSPKESPASGEETPHTWEHSLEVQLPFLQSALEGFQLVPVVFGDADAKAAAEELAGHLDPQTILVASSDLSHYHPYEKAKGLDKTCIEAILQLNPVWMKTQEACGKVPILTLIHLARQRGWKARLLDYRNSGDTSGDKSGVVGYAAIAFYKAATAEAANPSPIGSFTPEEQEYMLNLAHKTLVEAVNQRGLREIDEASVPGRLKSPRACFVTLTRHGQLRGCIGHIFPREPLFRAIVDNASSAALRDHRFPPVQPEELEEIEIEVSILTVPEPLDFTTPDELQAKLRPNVDGVVLMVGASAATYLPQVWRQLPEKEEFLRQLCHKAGLPDSAWRDPSARILVYQVEAFSRRFSVRGETRPQTDNPGRRCRRRGDNRLGS